MTASRPIRIATRKSALALWQAEHVAQQLRQAWPEQQVELVPMSTRGDELLDRSLAAIGGKGLFLKELEQAMRKGEADIAVHSMKDVPFELPEGFTIAAILARENPFDALVGAPSLDSLQNGAVVGTASLRRQAQILHRYPHLDIRVLRGNVNTRLQKLDQGEYDAIVLACAGLIRLKFTERIDQQLTSPDWIPAVGQGAVGIECCSNRTDIQALLAPLTCPITSQRVAAERAVSKALGGSCHTPFGAYAERQKTGNITMQAFVGSTDGSTMLKAQDQGPSETVVANIIQQLKNQGADAIMESL